MIIDDCHMVPIPVIYFRSAVKGKIVCLSCLEVLELDMSLVIVADNKYPVAVILVAGNKGTEID